MKFLVLGTALLAGCSSSPSLKYGFLAGSDYQFFPPTRQIDLKGTPFNFIFTDTRSETVKPDCSGEDPDKNSELEGTLGYRYFTSYFKAMADTCHGRLDSTLSAPIYVSLQVLRPKFSGFISVTVHGIVQFTIHTGDTQRVYCSDMQDGDPDSPYSTSSFATRRSAMRGMIGASCRRAIQQYFEDVYNSVHRGPAKE